MKQTKRIFIGIPLQQNVVEQINHIKKGYPDLKSVKWTKPENLHITVIFIGDFEAEKITDLINNIENSLAEVSFFTLDFNKLEIIYNRKQPVMFWASFCSNSMFNILNRKLSEAVKGLKKIKVDKRELIPHITLARIKLIKNDAIKPLISNVMLDQIVVDQVILWESILLPQGPQYNPLKVFKLD